MREVRLEKDREALVALRHGEVVKFPVLRLIERLKLRRLLILVLRRVPLVAGSFPYKVHELKEVLSFFS